MLNRLFVLLYIIGAAGLVLFIPIYSLANINFDRIVISDFKAQCNDNGQYVVLQGSQPDEHMVMSEDYLKDQGSTFKKQLNFYCQYYSDIQPHIQRYLASKDLRDRAQANIEFNKFEDSVWNSVNSYPELYQLIEVSKKNNYSELSAILSAIILAVVGFIILQVLRMSYLYVVFNKVVWHPFRLPVKSN